jgi:hypothetical protein
MGRALLYSHDGVVAVAADRLDVEKLDGSHFGARGGVGSVFLEKMIEHSGLGH